MGDLTALVMTGAPSTHPNLFAACVGIGVVVFAAAMWVWFVVANCLDWRDQARTQTVPADSPNEIREEVA
jgi:hypothetical protein